MSADNYYTVKFNSDDLKWYVIMGFMSTLEDGIPATIREGDVGFEDYDEAMSEAFKDWSEYGVIEEDDDLKTIVTDEQFKVYARKRIETLRWYLGGVKLMRKSDETVESYWSNELNEEVEIREFPEWNELDLYIHGDFAQTFVTMDAVEQYLGHYYMTRDFAIGQGR